MNRSSWSCKRSTFSVFRKQGVSEGYALLFTFLLQSLRQYRIYHEQLTEICSDFCAFTAEKDWREPENSERKGEASEDAPPFAALPVILLSEAFQQA